MNTSMTAKKVCVRPLFTIIIPVYNVAPYLAECLDSVRAQTDANWEALCIDDGSFDASVSLLDTYARLDPRIHVIHQRNAGVSSARNRALDAARGDWICFLDGDDVLHPKTISWINRCTCQYPLVQMIRYEYKKFDKEVDFDLGSDIGQSQVEDLSSVVPLEHMGAYMWQYAFFRNAFNGLWFKPYIGGEDRLYLVGCLERATSVVRMDAICYGYRQRMTSAVHSPMSVNKLLSEIGYMTDAIEICNKAPKVMSFLSISWVRDFLSRGVIDYTRNLKKDEACFVWQRWRQKIPYLLRQKEFTRGERIRLRLCLNGRSYWIAIVLCHHLPRLYARLRCKVVSFRNRCKRFFGGAR